MPDLIKKYKGGISLIVMALFWAASLGWQASATNARIANVEEKLVDGKAERERMRQADQAILEKLQCLNDRTIEIQGDVKALRARQENK